MIRGLPAIVPKQLEKLLPKIPPECRKDPALARAMRLSCPEHPLLSMHIAVPPFHSCFHVICSGLEILLLFTPECDARAAFMKSLSHINDEESKGKSILKNAEQLILTATVAAFTLEPVFLVTSEIRVFTWMLRFMLYVYHYYNSDDYHDNKERLALQVASAIAAAIFAFGCFRTGKLKHLENLYFPEFAVHGPRQDLARNGLPPAAMNDGRFEVPLRKQKEVATLKHATTPIDAEDHAKVFSEQFAVYCKSHAKSRHSKRPFLHLEHDILLAGCLLRLQYPSQPDVVSSEEKKRGKKKKKKNEQKEETEEKEEEEETDEKEEDSAKEQEEEEEERRRRGRKRRKRREGRRYSTFQTDRASQPSQQICRAMPEQDPGLFDVFRSSTT